jgi:phage protein D
MRDPEIQNRYGNAFEVTFPDFPGFDQTPYSFTLIQKMGHHDTVQLFYSSLNINYLKAFSSGVAVEVRWSNDAATGVFLGYVTDLDYPTSSAIQKPLTITCSGTSFPLKEKLHKIWKNVTASEVVTQIAIFNKLKPVVTQSDVRFPQISFSGHSQWEKLQELSKRMGYACQVYGVELHFHPIDVMLNRFLTIMPVMAFLDQTVTPMNQFASQTLDHFESVQGDLGEFQGNSKATKVLGGVDPLTGKLYKTTANPNTVGKSLRLKTKDPLFYDIDTSVVVTDGLTSQSLANAKAQLGRLTTPGYGFGQGDPRIAPWRTIEVRGTGEKSDGYWVVSDVVHTVNADGKYKVEFNCVVDSSGANKQSAFRPSNAGMVPTVDLNAAITSGANTVTTYKLSNPEPMTNQSSTGYNVVPRRWVAV